MRYIIPLFLISLSTTSFAQIEKDWSKHFPDTRSKLAFFADIMYNGANANHRIWAASQFEDLLLRHTKEYNFKELMPFDWAQVKSPSDSSFHLITWQFLGKNDHYIPKGIITQRNGETVQLKYDETLWEDPDYQAFETGSWPGAVYYEMIEFPDNRKDQFLLFGYHGWDNSTRLRVIDVLDLSEEVIRFGAPVFMVKDDPVRPDIQYRKILRYASQSSVKINYADSSNMILFDHLIPATTPEGKLTAVPDGSYEAFQWGDGKWRYIEKVYDQTQDTPPGDPKPASEKRDLFGRKQ